MVQNLKVVLAVLICLSLMALSGCGKKSTTAEEVMTTEVDKEAIGGEEPLDSKPLESLRVSEGRTTEGMFPVYFNYDSSEIKADQVSRIEGNSTYINSVDMAIRIEGNCDPRGTNEYNMALGERRALGAKKYLVNLGVDESRLTTVSYGEERMLLHGHDELSWSQNRRADFVAQQ